MDVVTINPVDGTPITLSGKVRGHWIAHKDGRTYKVTHIPSGYFIRKYIDLQRDAVALAELFDSLPIDASAYPMPAGHMETLIATLQTWCNERSESVAARKKEY